MDERLRLSVEEITQRSWALHRPNGGITATLVLLKGGGVVGYEHPNEASWIAHEDAVAFVSRDGAVTSISMNITRNDSDMLEIHMSHPAFPSRLAHVLVEVRNPDARPTSVAGPEAHPARTARKSTGNYIMNLCIPDAALQFLDSRISRVFFVANNNSIDPSAFDSWNLAKDDVIVQYNLPAFFNLLRGVRCHKLHVMYPNGKTCWGFTDEAQPELDYMNQELSSLTFGTAHWVPPLIKQYFESLGNHIHYMALVPKMHIGLYSYPIDKVPSAGFISVGFFRLLNWIRIFQDTPALELTMIGFTGYYASGNAWPGHDFSFEQKAYDTWLELRRLDIKGAVQ